MIANCIVLNKESGQKTACELDFAIDAMKIKQNEIWIDILDPAEADLKIIQDALAVHELTIEDLQKPHVRPKIEEFEDHIFVVFKALNLNTQEDSLDTINLNFLLFKNVLVTVHLEPLISIRDTIDDVMKRPDILKRGVDFLMYILVDRVIDKYLLVLDNLDEAVDDIENKLFQKFDPSISEKIFQLKSDIAHMRRRVAPQREMLANLSGRPHPLIHPKTQVYFRDVYDHIIRIYDNLESYRDILQSAMDSYITQVSNRMNEIMKVLSIVATIILPLNLLAGLYGTNFEILPGSKGPWAFFTFCSILISIAISGSIYFRFKKWL